MSDKGLRNTRAFDSGSGNRWTWRPKRGNRIQGGVERTGLQHPLLIIRHLSSLVDQLQISVDRMGFDEGRRKLCRKLRLVLRGCN